MVETLILRRSDLTRSTCGDAKLTPRTGRGAGIARPYITTYIAYGHSALESKTTPLYVRCASYIFLMRCYNQNGYCLYYSSLNVQQNGTINIVLLIDGLQLHTYRRTRAGYDSNLQHRKATATDEWWKLWFCDDLTSRDQFVEMQSWRRERVIAGPYITTYIAYRHPAWESKTTPLYVSHASYIFLTRCYNKNGCIAV